MTAALANVRVLDATTGIAGPVATMLLGDLGADVIRLWLPGDEDLPGAPMWHRNKRIVTTTPDDANIRLLAQGADVIVTSSQTVPAWLQAAGISPRAIHLSMPPQYEAVDARTADAMMAAWCGVACRQSSFDGGPVEPVAPYLSYVHGVWAATCAIAALIERNRSGIGQTVTVDAIHGVLAAATTWLAVSPDEALPANAVGPWGPNPTFSTYRCSDGDYLFLGALAAHFKTTAFAVLGIADIFDDPRIGGDHHQLYAPDNRGWVRDRMTQAFATRTRDEWLGLLAAGDCPAAPHLPREQWLDHSQIAALGQRCVVDDPVTGTTVIPGVPVTMEGTPTVAPAARRFSDRADWLNPPIALPTNGTRGAGGPLAGLRLMNLGAVLAGPYAGMLLAELGADVIKIEPVTGDAYRVIGYMHNRGLRSLAIDLRDPDAAAACRDIVRQSDGVIDNFRPGVLERLGLDWATLSQADPSVVSVSITAFGDTGPLAGNPGFDPVLQALSGMMLAQGGDDFPVSSTLPVTDVGSAAMAALGMVAGLFHKARSGQGQRIGTTLAGVAAFMQCEEIITYASYPQAPRGGRDYAGPSDHSRYYRTLDGVIRVALPPATQLTLAFEQAKSAEGITWVNDQGGTAVTARSYRDVVSDPAMLSGHYIATIKWPDARTTDVPGRYARFSATNQERLLVPPGLGEHSLAVMADFNVDTALAVRLIAQGVVVQGEAMQSVANVGYR